MHYYLKLLKYSPCDSHSSTCLYSDSRQWDSTAVSLTIPFLFCQLFWYKCRTCFENPFVLYVTIQKVKGKAQHCSNI